MSNPDDLLAELRQEITRLRAEKLDRDEEIESLYDIASNVDALDAHLSAGGQPPQAWSEGPDAPELQDLPITLDPGAETNTLAWILSHYVLTNSLPEELRHLAERIIPPAQSVGRPIPVVIGTVAVNDADAGVVWTPWANRDSGAVGFLATDTAGHRQYVYLHPVSSDGRAVVVLYFGLAGDPELDQPLSDVRVLGIIDAPQGD